MDSSGDGLVLQGTQMQAFTSNSEMFAATLDKTGKAIPVDKKANPTRGMVGGFLRNSGFLSEQF